MIYNWLKCIFRKFPCIVLGHRYEVAQEFSPFVRRVICRHCKGDWGMNDNVKAFIPWDAELTELHEWAHGKVVDPWEDLTNEKEVE